MAETPIERAKDFVSGTVDKTRSAVTDGLDTARERFEEAADDFSKRYRKVRKSAEKTADTARERYDDAVEAVQDGYEKVRKDVKRVSGDVSEYVRENPGKSLLMAAGVGFLIGLLFRRDRGEY